MTPNESVSSFTNKKLDIHVLLISYILLRYPDCRDIKPIFANGKSKLIPSNPLIHCSYRNTNTDPEKIYGIAWHKQFYENSFSECVNIKTVNLIP